MLSIFFFRASKPKIHQYINVTKKFLKAQEGTEMTIRSQPGPGGPPVVHQKFLVAHRKFYKFLIKCSLKNKIVTILNYVASACK